MTATSATTGAPAWARRCWIIGPDLFVEIPVKDSVPYITRLPIAHGTATLMDLLRSAHDVAKASTARTPFSGQGAPSLPHPTIKKVTSPYTDDQREKARNVLARLGITKKG